MLKVYNCKVPVLDMGGGDIWFPVTAVARELEYKTPKMNSMRTLVEPGQLMTIRTSALRHGDPVSIVSLEGVRNWCGRVQARRKLFADRFLRWVENSMRGEMRDPKIVTWMDASDECENRSKKALKTREGREAMMEDLSVRAKDMSMTERAEELARIYEWRADDEQK